DLNPGAYNVVLTVTTSNGCTITDSLQVVAGTVPIANFNVSRTTICAGDTVSFNNLSIGANSFLWNFGDNTTSTVSEPIKEYSIPGTYTVMLTAMHNLCPDTMQWTNLITVLPPSAQMMVAYDCDTVNKITLTNNSIGATSYLWIFGDGSSTSTGFDPVHYYSPLGNYTLMLTTHNSSSGCRDTSTMILDLYQPDMDISSSDSGICISDTVTFTGIPMTGTFSGFDWIINGQTFADTFINIDYYNFLDTGHFDIAIVAMDDKQCLRTFTQPKLQTVGGPKLDFTGNPLIGCSPLLVNFNDLSQSVSTVPIVSRFWDFGDNTSTTTSGANTSHTYASGLFDVKIIATDALGCVDSLTIPNFVSSRKPNAIFTVDDETNCLGTAVQFTNVSGGVQLTYDWDFGDGTSSAIKNPSHIYQ